MNSTLEEMALRKKVLQARSALHRLEIQRHLQGVDESLGWIRTGAKTLGSLSVRTGLLGLALRRATGSPVGQAVALTSGLVLLSKIAGLAFQLFRGSPRKSVT